MLALVKKPGFAARSGADADETELRINLKSGDFFSWTATYSPVLEIPGMFYKNGGSALFAADCRQVHSRKHAGAMTPQN